MGIPIEPQDNGKNAGLVKIIAPEVLVVQTHDAVSVPLSSNNISPTWIDCSKFSWLSVTGTIDAGVTSQINAVWSNDGVTNHGLEAVAASGTATLKQGSTRVKARYLKIQVQNSDGAAAHTMSAWAYLSAN